MARYGDRRRPGCASRAEAPRAAAGRRCGRTRRRVAVILDAARSEFASSGYAATNMESVARRAGVSTKTLYRLIPNKAALFEAMITDRMNRFASVVRSEAHATARYRSSVAEALIVCGELLLDSEVIRAAAHDPQRERAISRDRGDFLSEGDPAHREHAGRLAEGASRTRPHRDR